MLASITLLMQDDPHTPLFFVKRLAEPHLRVSNEALLSARIPRAQRLASRLAPFLPPRVTPFVII